MNFKIMKLTITVSTLGILLASSAYPQSQTILNYLNGKNLTLLRPIITAVRFQAPNITCNLSISNWFHGEDPLRTQIPAGTVLIRDRQFGWVNPDAQPPIATSYQDSSGRQYALRCETRPPSRRIDRMRVRELGREFLTGLRVTNATESGSHRKSEASEETTAPVKSAE